MITLAETKTNKKKKLEKETQKKTCQGKDLTSTLEGDSAQLAGGCVVAYACESMLEQWVAVF